MSSYLPLFQFFLAPLLLYACQPASSPLPVDADPADLPYILTIQSSQASNARLLSPLYVRDLDRDGKSEAINIGADKALNDFEPNCFTIFNYADQSVIEQCNFNGEISIDFIDIQHDLTQEIFVTIRRKGSLRGALFTWRGDSLAAFDILRQDTAASTVHDITVKAIGTLDVDEDGRNEIILSVRAGYTYQPRGIYAIDYQSGETKWIYTLGTSPDGGILADTDGDGIPEIILVSGAPANGGGRDINGTNDYNSYLIILNSKGERLVQKRFGGKYTGVTPFARDLDKDGRMEIILMKVAQRNDPNDINMVAYWDHTSGELIKKRPSRRLLIPNTAFIDIEEDGIEEFITIWKKGDIEIRNMDNRVVRSCNLGEDIRNSTRVLVTDLTHDGRPEIAIIGQSALYIFSRQLELLARFPSPGAVLQPLQDGEEGQRLLLSGPEAIYELALVRNSWSFLPVSPVALTGFMAGSGLTVLLMFYFFRQGMIRSRGNEPENPRSVQRAIAWAAVTQELAHELKTPLASVLLAAERLQMQYKKDGAENEIQYDKYVDHVVNEVRRLRILTDGFLRLAQLQEPEKHKIDINLLIRQCVQTFQPSMPTGIEIELDLETELPEIRADENQLRSVFDVLIENAAQAMQQEGKLRISTRFVQALSLPLVQEYHDATRIEISDTGEGIPADKLQKIFEPFYSSKKDGTGLGLTIARKIVEDHDGTIEVKSEVGIGTVFVIIIPACTWE